VARSAKKQAATKAVQKPKQKQKRPSKTTWRLIDRTSTIAAGVIATQAAALVWRAATGQRPPSDDASRDPAMQTREAIAWAVLAGASAGVLKVVLNRQAVAYWVRSTGDLPPGFKNPRP
jgi:hypothetical protein